MKKMKKEEIILSRSNLLARFHSILNEPCSFLKMTSLYRYEIALYIDEYLEHRNYSILKCILYLN